MKNVDGRAGKAADYDNSLRSVVKGCRHPTNSNSMTEMCQARKAEIFHIARQLNG